MILKEAEDEKIDFKLDNTETDQHDEISINVNDIGLDKPKKSIGK